MMFAQQTNTRDFPHCSLDGNSQSLRPCRSSSLSLQSNSEDRTSAQTGSISEEDGPNTRLKARLLRAEACLESRTSDARTPSKSTPSALHGGAPKTVLSQPWRSSAQTHPAAPSTSAKPRNTTRKVRFAFGPLTDTPDGHPFTGPPLMRRLDIPNSSFCSILYKKEVLQLEVLLGDEYSSSITKLKRRVNLLPMVYTPRPFATAGTFGSSNSSNSSNSGSVPGMDWV